MLLVWLSNWHHPQGQCWVRVGVSCHCTRTPWHYPWTALRFEFDSVHNLATRPFRLLATDVSTQTMQQIHKHTHMDALPIYPPHEAFQPLWCIISPSWQSYRPPIPDPLYVPIKSLLTPATGESPPYPPFTIPHLIFPFSRYYFLSCPAIRTFSLFNSVFLFLSLSAL